jgi:hypothetical protein
MKFFISMFICTSVLASPIVIFHESNEEDALIYRDLLKRNYYVPDELMTIQIVRSCEKAKGLGKLDLCLKNNGDLLLVSVDVKFVNESIKVFKAP